MLFFNLLERKTKLYFGFIIFLSALDLVILHSFCIVVLIRGVDFRLEIYLKIYVVYSLLRNV